jgi:hypothetical protein
LYLINFGAASQMIAENPYKLEMGFKIETGIKVGVGVNREEKELANAIVHGLKAIRANGAEKAIYERCKIDYSVALAIDLLTKQGSETPPNPGSGRGVAAIRGDDVPLLWPQLRRPCRS